MYLDLLLVFLRLYTAGRCESFTLSAPKAAPSTKAVPHSFAGLGIDGTSIQNMPVGCLSSQHPRDPPELRWEMALTLIHSLAT